MRFTSQQGMICRKGNLNFKNHSQKAVGKRFFVIMKLRFIDNKGEKHDIRRNSEKRLGMASNRSL